MFKFSNLIFVAFLATNMNATNNINKYFTKTGNINSFSKQINGLSDEQIDQAILGKSFFKIPWVESPSATTARDGLGPLFNANTCISCHPNNGIGSLFTKKGDISRSNIIKVSIPNNNSRTHKKIFYKNGFIPSSIYGGQISVNGVFNVPFEAKPNIKFQKSTFIFADGEKVELQKPIISLEDLQYGDIEKDVSLSFRKAPALVGLGLLELVSDETILKNVDENDKDGDGISGRANMVFSPQTNTYELGRYTYKASAPSVVHQVAGAANNDMSLTSKLFPKDNCTDAQVQCKKAPKGRDEFDLPMQRVEAIAFYLKSLKTPLPKQTKEFKVGKRIFNSIGCVKCHVDKLVSVNGIELSPYSDMLLHDMGEGLSDGRVEFDASKQEWKTTPLWGLGSYAKTLKKAPRYLHDGRARTLQEAILWHGGEAEQIKQNYVNLPKNKRESLLNFLKGL